jgi:hypothetical protein
MPTTTPDRLDTTCPACGASPNDLDGHPIQVGATLNVVVTAEMTDDGAPSFLTHAPSSDEVTGASLMCKRCGWWRELDLDEWRSWIGGEAEQFHLSAVTATVTHPSLDTYNDG